MNTHTIHLKKWITICITFLCSINIFGLHYSNLSVKNGLSSRKVFAISKDNKGYVWLATGSGIDKYNGEKFVSYNLVEQNNDLRKPKGVVSDLEGNIYAFTEKRIYKYDSHSDCFIALEQIALLNRETITSIYFCQNDIMWIGTTDGLHTFNKQKEYGEVKSLNRIRVYTITSDTDKNLWIGTDNGLIKLVTNVEHNIDEAYIDFQSLSDIRVESLFYDEVTKRLWIGTFSEGLKILDLQSLTLNYEKQFESRFPIRKISLIDSTKVWVGIDGSGIYEFDRKNPQLIKIYNQSSIEEANKILSNGIYDIESDESFIWVCTYNSGLMVINKETIQTNLFQNSISSEQSISNNHVNAILEDRDGNFWFGTNHGISVLNPITNRWRQFLQNHNTQSVVLSLSQDDLGNIWAGGYATDLTIISPQTGKVSKVDKASNNGAGSRYVYSIVNDKMGSMWFAGVINELTQYNQTTQQVTRYDVRGINKIVNYDDTTLLLASIKGVLIFDKKTGKYEKITFETPLTNISKHPFINNIKVDPTNSEIIWVATENSGLICYNLKRREVKAFFNEAQGLSSSSLYGILFDNENRMWISSEYGLNCLSATRENINIYTQNDGLTSGTFNFLAYTKLRNGNMLWGTSDGAIETTPQLTNEERQQSINLIFEDLTIFNERITTLTSNSPLETSIDETKLLELKYKQHSFSLDFININYKDSRTLYSWYLEGFDVDWSNPSENHKAIYTNIPSGKYVFKVKAYDVENRKLEITREIVIIIESPIWATPYAYVFYVLILCSVVYFLHKVYMNRLESIDSDKKIRFFINMAHDIRTPLTLIKAPLNEIEEENLSDSGFSALDLAKKNTEKLLNMVTQLLDFQKIEREAMALHVERTNIKEFVEHTATNFLMLASEKQIDFSLKLPPHETEGWIDRKKLSAILDNLLSNSIKYTPKHGNVLLKLTITKEKAIIEIVDDGIGISNSEQSNLFKRFYRAENAANSAETGSGIGLLLTKRMVALHKGHISFTSVENMGTSFKIEIPVSKDDYLDSEIISTKIVEDIAIEEVEEDSNGKTKILLAEDNDDLRGYLAKYLKKRYTILEVGDGQTALNVIQDFNPDFIISDILMPNVTGLELVQQLKKDIATCHIPIILLTSLSERDDVIKGYEVGADDYITKPFDMPILENKIQAIMRNRALYKKKYIDRSAFEDSSNTVTELDKQFMSQVLDKIEDNISNENFTIDALAIEMAMSRTVFYNKIRSLTTQSPIDLIIDVRMKKAASLLRENRYTIAEVAYLTGSTNPKYFSTAFKKYYGLTPSQYIEKNDDAERV